MASLSDQTSDKVTETSSVDLSEEVEIDDYEDIEAARERTDSELKSEEILCNYGDIILEDSSEDVATISHKPASEGVLAQVRLFTGKQVTSTQVRFNLPSSDISDQDSLELEAPSDESKLSNNYITLHNSIYCFRH